MDKHEATFSADVLMDHGLLVVFHKEPLGYTLEIRDGVESLGTIKEIGLLPVTLRRDQAESIAEVLENHDLITEIDYCGEYATVSVYENEVYSGEGTENTFVFDITQ